MTDLAPLCEAQKLKHIAFDRIHATRVRSLFLCMSLSPNRRALLGDMHYIAPISLSFFSTAWFGSPSSGRL
jgi:hypothetical protein